MHVIVCLYCQGVIGLYRGFLVTLSRELPFALLQFPLWEYLKVTIVNQIFEYDCVCLYRAVVKGLRWPCCSAKPECPHRVLLNSGVLLYHMKQHRSHYFIIFQQPVRVTLGKTHIFCLSEVFCGPNICQKCVSSSAAHSLGRTRCSPIPRSQLGRGHPSQTLPHSSAFGASIFAHLAHQSSCPPLKPDAPQLLQG